MREKHLYLEGRFVYSFGKNGQGLTDEFNDLNQLLMFLGKDNHITLHNSFIDQCDDVYDLVFDISPRDNVDYLFKNNEETIES